MLLRPSFLCLAICAALQTSALAADVPASTSSGNEEVEFNDQFLFNTGTTIDVSRFSRGNPVVAGSYKTQILLNGKKTLLTDFTFKENGTVRATPCFTPKLLLQIGIKSDPLKDALSKGAEGQDICVSLDGTLPGASWEYDAGTQELSLNVPQIYVDRHSNGYVDPSLWEDGITAGMLSYDLNAWHSDSADSADNVTSATDATSATSADSATSAPSGSGRDAR